MKTNTTEAQKKNKKSITILVVDDDVMVLDALKSILERSGYLVHAASNPSAALDLVTTHPIDVAIIDLMLGKENGIVLMKKIRLQFPNMLTIIVTGFGTIEKAVEAMHQGAWDFIAKPITSGILLEKLERLEEICNLRRGQDYRRKVIDHNFEFSGVIGPSQIMAPVYEAVLRAAHSSLPILIEGETGSGKEFIAEAVHLNSQRKSHSYVVMDCTATPNTLIEATLFGSTKGAFTGAVERKGLLEAAHRGSLFLDEVGEIEADIQPKLLRCLETGRFRPVGATKETVSDFRIICATNRDLHAETKTGSFRTDLFYRISAVRISLPPLRERVDDVPVIAQQFLARIRESNEREIEFSTDALKMLCAYPWPGNIRQMRFVIESAFFQCDGAKIGPEHLSLDGVTPPQAASAAAQPAVDTSQDFKSFRDNALLRAETAYIKKLLDETEGDVRDAASKARLTREAMYRVMSRCGLSASDFRKN
ncbi:MAG: sigma-54 dependent transcriptional regulator [Candidatus Hinthialibacter antarcticus]|nr:sigma-54 dependent transcriptional regulator [Candidatus Hinthialibacter antarcticus]